MKREKHTIDATGIPMGRLAVEIAGLLRGKHKPSFTYNKDEGDFVEVKNIRDMKVTGKKMDKKLYRHHSGYIGGLKEIPMKKIWEKDPGQCLRTAVMGMLPKNKLRARMIKRLNIHAN